MTPNEYIDKNYYSLKNEFFNITKGERTDLFDDYFHDVLTIFLTHPKAQDVIDNDTAKFFLIRIGLNQWRSKTSTFHYQYRVPFTELTEELLVSDELYDVEIDVLIDVMMHSLDEMYKDDELRYQAMIVILYHSLGNNYSEVERQFNIPRTTVRNIYLKGLDNLKHYVNNNLKNLKHGTFNLSKDISNVVSDWCNSFGTDEQQTLSVASQLFKSKYFKPSKL